MEVDHGKSVTYPDEMAECQKKFYINGNKSSKMTHLLRKHFKIT